MKNRKQFWRALCGGDTTVLYDDSYLIKNKFAYPDDTLQDLFDYLKKRKNLAIAGGYPTLHYLDKDLDDYPSSDIDIFMFGVDVNCKRELKKLFKLLHKAYGIERITTKNNTDEISVISINLKNHDRVIQVIGAECETLAELLNTFDYSYCKCAIHKGTTYVTIDAQYSKKKNVAMFYKIRFMPCRIKKVLNLGFKLYGWDSSQHINCNYSKSKERVVSKKYAKDNFVLTDWNWDYIYAESIGNILFNDYTFNIEKTPKYFYKMAKALDY